MPNPMGPPVSLEAEDNFTTSPQQAATADGNGPSVLVGGYSGAITLEVLNSGSGASTVNLEGSLDGSRWYPVGYQQIDATNNPSRSTAPIAAAPATQHTYAVLDSYNYLRTRLSGTAAGASVTTTLSLNPV